LLCGWLPPTGEINDVFIELSGEAEYDPEAAAQKLFAGLP